jgi:putative ABC transport system substrate-binding protein
VHRRESVGVIGSAAEFALAARAQQPANMKRIAMVHPTEKVGNMTTTGRRPFQAFFEELGR